MAHQSWPPSPASTSGFVTRGSRFGLPHPSRSSPTFNPFTISNFRTRMSYASLVSHEESATCAYIPSPRRCTPAASRNASSVFALRVSTLDFSVACSLFHSLCPLLRAPVLYFQQLTASFPKIPGWGVVLYSGGLESTLSHRSVLSAPVVWCTRCGAANERRGKLKSAEIAV